MWIEGAFFLDYFDLHCDTISECEHTLQDLSENCCALSLRRGEVFDRWGQVFALFVPDRMRGEAAFAYTERLYAYFRLQMSRNKEHARFCTGDAEMEQTLGEGKTACLLSVENGCALGGRAERVRLFYDWGVRMMTLTWDGENELGGGSRASCGLTDFGRSVLWEMKRCGMVPDVSHLNERTFWQVCAETDVPLIATHSDCFFCHPHARNLRDEQVRELIRRGGLIGLNLYPVFLGAGDPVRRVMENILHLLELGGESCIALGCDYDGAPMAEGWEHVDDLAQLYDRLLGRGMAESVLEKCFYRNARDFFLRALFPNSTAGC